MKITIKFVSIFAVLLAGCGFPDDDDLFGPVPASVPSATSTPGSTSGSSSSSSSSSSTSGSSSSTSSGSSSSSSGGGGEPEPCQGADLNTDPANCGACDVVCPTMHLGTWTTDLVCVRGSCKLDCSTHPANAGGRYGDCDGEPANGCEADFYGDANCGGCGLACQPFLHCKITDYVTTAVKCI